MTTKDHMRDPSRPNDALQGGQRAFGAEGGAQGHVGQQGFGHQGQALDHILLKVGQLNYTWTNTESLLIHLIAGLLATDKEAATIVFLTLNTTRARIDLVERLVKQRAKQQGNSQGQSQGQDAEMREDILSAMSVLTREASLRNRYNHCIYSFDHETGGVSTILMRVQDRKNDIRMGKTQRVDDQEMAKIETTIDRLQRLNLEIWRIVKEYRFPL